MTIQKFKTFEEAQSQLWDFNPDQKYYNSISELFNLANFLKKPVCEKGIHKFRTFKQANIHRLKNSKKK